jgi:hypothetical protein
MLAVIWVGVLTVNEFTVMSPPKLGVLIPLAKPVPVNITSNVAPSPALVGAIAVRVGGGFPAVTLNAPVRVAVPPPGAGFVTLTFRTPVDVPAEIVMFAVSEVELLTEAELTVMLVSKYTVVTPETKPVPVSMTFRVLPFVPPVGEMLVSVGTGYDSPAVHRENEPTPYIVILLAEASRVHA